MLEAVDEPSGMSQRRPSTSMSAAPEPRSISFTPSGEASPGRNVRTTLLFTRTSTPVPVMDITSTVVASATPGPASARARTRRLRPAPARRGHRAVDPRRAGAGLRRLVLALALAGPGVALATTVLVMSITGTGVEVLVNNSVVRTLRPGEASPEGCLLYTSDAADERSS